ncbi:hypothetical protein PoB_003295700 [Plakobranchus ocellatus]|uniref:Uncharacterized protein n=1 Tax=Plakobranchus ocellatus TaxID=259542 RepID=A0AAV4AHE4_9GAST|nr:hypothetical protein PoB_003295700 [Plakobranchus ocellatus]
MLTRKRRRRRNAFTDELERYGAVSVPVCLISFDCQSPRSPGLPCFQRSDELRTPEKGGTCWIGLKDLNVRFKRVSLFIASPVEAGVIAGIIIAAVTVCGAIIAAIIFGPSALQMHLTEYGEKR